jgi:hypothetical protein
MTKKAKKAKDWNCNSKACRTIEKRNEIAALYLNGVTLVDIAVSVGLSGGQIDVTLRWIRNNQSELLIIPAHPACKTIIDGN